MRTKKEKELGKEFSSLISEISTYDAGTDEHKVRLNAISKETQVIDTLTKLSLAEEKSKLDSEHYKNDLEFKERQFEFEKYKFNEDLLMKDSQRALDEKKLAFEKEKFKNETEMKEKSEKRQFILSIVACTAPAVIGVISNIIAMRHYNKLAIRSLNMEYIDNSITPRSYNECMNNINKFVSKK